MEKLAEIVLSHPGGSPLLRVSTGFPGNGCTSTAEMRCVVDYVLGLPAHAGFDNETG